MRYLLLFCVFANAYIATKFAIHYHQGDGDVYALLFLWAASGFIASSIAWFIHPDNRVDSD